MSSTTVAQHTTQPLNFGPEWLRALSTPDAASTTTPVPSSSASSSGNVFKFSATKYRYSKEQILALRINVTERLAEDVRNEILENLRDVESVFRPNIIEPLTLSAPTPEEATKLSSLSSYISGRTPGGGRGGHSSQQTQQQSHEPRSNRGGSSMSNGRGGSRGRGGRENSFGLNRGNNNPDDHGENGGGGGDEASASSAGASWSRGAGFHSRGGAGGASLGTRVRSYDDREQAPSFRRGGGSTRQTSEAWRRSRGDDDENNEQNEDVGPAKGSSSWTTRGVQPRRGGNSSVGGGTMDHRTKSNDKWNHSDDRPGQSNSYESNHPRGSEGGGWRTNPMSDRDLNSRRPPAKREKMPEWMNDNNEADVQLGSATFEQGGTFTTAPATKSNTSNNNEAQKLPTQSSSEEIPSQPATTVPSKTQEEPKVERSTPPRTDNAVVNVPTATETIASKTTPPVKQSIPSWDDEFVATTVVEATLADDHDYSPPVSNHPTPHPIPMEPTPPSVPIIPQPQRIQSVPVVPAPAPAPSLPLIDDTKWYYRDPQNTVQGPFSSADMERWYTAGYFTILLPVKRFGETHFTTIQQLIKDLGRLPFRSEAPSLPPPSTPAMQSSVACEPQKFNPLAYPGTTSSSTNYLEDFLMQQQQQQRSNMQHSALFNRQTSMPSSSTDRKVTPASSSSIINQQIQSFFAGHPQQQSASALFSTNLANDPTAAYQQSASQLQRSISASNQQQIPGSLYDDGKLPFRQLPSSSNPSAFFGASMSISQSQQQSSKPDDIMTRLAQAMQSHGQQQQEKADEQRRIEQQRREIEVERLKLAQKMEQLRLREEDERRRLEQQKQQQQQMKLDEEILRKQEAELKKQLILNQMKEMTKTMGQKVQKPTVNNQVKVEPDPLFAFQQSIQFQKEQQEKIEAQKEENIRRYQQQLREQLHPSPVIQAQSSFKLPETANWARHSSQSNENSSQPLNFAEIQKQEQEQERRAREAVTAAQQLAKSDGQNMGNASSNAKPGSWARTLFAGGASNASLEGEAHETAVSPESPISSYNQQATNAVLSLLNIHPKTRSTSQQQGAPWITATKATPSTSLYDIQLQQQQQLQNEVKQQQPLPSTAAHTSSSTPAWGGVFSASNSSPQTGSLFWGENQNPSPQPPPPSKPSGNKASTPWNESKPAATASGSSTKSNSSNNAELTKSEREARHLFNIARTQDALTKWAQAQFKDNLQAIDVPTLVQLLKDIETAEEIIEYVQPYIGAVSKTREFASDFISKRKQLANAEPELDNERLNALAMAPASSSANSSNAADEGFQLASSNGQKKKAKKMKGQKIDVKQLGFMVNNRPEQRDGIDRVPM